MQHQEPTSADGDSLAYGDLVEEIRACVGGHVKLEIRTGMVGDSVEIAGELRSAVFKHDALRLEVGAGVAVLHMHQGIAPKVSQRSVEPDCIRVTYENGAQFLLCPGRRD